MYKITEEDLYVLPHYVKCILKKSLETLDTHA